MGTRETVPLRLPAPVNSRADDREIGIAGGLLLFWLFPRRIGSYLSRMPLRWALTAHVTTVIIAVTTIGGALAIRSAPNVRTLEDIRALVAGYVLELCAVSGSPGWSGAWAYWVLLLLPAVEAGVLTVAALSLPLNASGESIRSLWSRSVRVVYWATTTWLPGVLVISAAILISGRPANSDSNDWYVQQPDWPRLTDAGWSVVVAGLVVNAIVFARAVLTGGTLYRGPRLGPGFEAREPTCERCGYSIVGLPLDGQCPECAERVSDSIHGGPRGETRWERDRLRSHGMITLIKTHASVLRSAKYFRGLRVRQDLVAARHFWWTTYLLLVTPILALFAALRIVTYAEETPEQYWVVLAAALLIPFAIGLVLTSLACWWGLARYGISDFRASAAVALYSSPLLWLGAVLAIVGACITNIHVDTSSMIDFYAFLVPADPWFTVFVAYWVVVGVWVLWLWRRICRGLRLVRFANS